jgi:hypothetical protein
MPGSRPGKLWIVWQKSHSRSDHAKRRSGNVDFPLRHRLPERRRYVPRSGLTHRISPGDSDLIAGTSKTARRRRWLLVSLGLIVVAWGQSAIWGARDILEFWKAESLDGVTKEVVIVSDARIAAEMAKRGIEAPHWLYVGNSGSPFPMVVSVDTDFTRSDIWWSPQRLYFFWCCGLHSKEPFYSRQLNDDL